MQFCQELAENIRQKVDSLFLLYLFLEQTEHLERHPHIARL